MKISNKNKKKKKVTSFPKMILFLKMFYEDYIWRKLRSKATTKVLTMLGQL